MSKYTLMIGEFSVSQANALSDGVFLSAVPPLTAWMGLAIALCLRLDKELLGVTPVIGEANLHRGHAKYVRYRSGQLSDVNNRGVQHPTIDDRRTSLNAYLLIDIDSDESLHEDEIQQALIGLRLAGGVMHPVRQQQRISVRVFVGDGKKTAPQLALAALPSYFFLLEDASRLVLAAREQGGLQGFDILTAPLRRWAGDETPAEQKKHLQLPERPVWLPDKQHGYFRPMAVGYQLLENPQQRQGARNNLPHAFAEPVFTLIRFRSVASVRKSHNPRSGDGGYVWRPGARAENVLGACLVAPTKKRLS
ncbi:MAG: type I-F CRISPR-associated protein Csy2 [Methylomonas sp.]|jgi:CRISPR type I-F-associated protein Csy2